MTIRTKCDKCGKALKAKDAAAGLSIPCPSCGVTLLVPAASDVGDRASAEVGDASADDQDSYDDYDEASYDDPSSDDYDGTDDEYEPPALKKRPSSRKNRGKSAVSPTASANRFGEQGLYFVIATCVLAVVVLGETVFLLTASPDGAPDVVDTGAANDVQSPVDVASSPTGATSSPAGVAFVSAKTSPSEDSAAITGSLQQMKQLLESGNTAEFFVRYAPVDQYRQWRDGRSRNPELKPGIPTEALLLALGEVSGVKPEIDDGVFAVVSAELPMAADAIGPGYDGEVKAAIRKAIDDLKAGEFRSFVTNMFPPRYLEIMLADGEQHSVLATLTAESPLVVGMLSDLELLQQREPEIDGDLATFRLPPFGQTGDSIVAVNSKIPAKLERTIIFSRIDAKWRFVDNTGAAQEAVAQQNGRAVRLVLEKIGRDWRLRSLP